MDFQIITDSSSDLTVADLSNDEIGFDVVPLTLRIGNNSYVDNDTMDKNIMLADPLSVHRTPLQYVYLLNYPAPITLHYRQGI